MARAEISFETLLTQTQLTNELETAGVLATLASHFGAYPVVTVEDDPHSDS